MGMLDMAIRTAVRVAVSPVAAVHDIVMLPANAMGTSKAMLPQIGKAIADDVRATISSGKALEVK